MGWGRKKEKGKETNKKDGIDEKDLQMFWVGKVGCALMEM